MGSGIYQEFEKVALERGEAVFVYQADHGSYRQVSYAQAWRESRALAGQLSDWGLAGGERVGILSENRYEWLVAYLAAAARGLTVVPLDPQLPEQEWLAYLRHAQVHTLFLSEKIAARLSPATENFASLRSVIQFGEDPAIFPGALSYGEIVARFRNAGPLPGPLSPRGDASLIFTSGTNGRPRGVLLSEENLLSNGRLINLGYNQAGEICASILPLHHVYGFSVALGTLLKSSSLLFYSNLDPDTLMHSFKSLRPHFLVGVPTFFERIGASIQNKVAESLPGILRANLPRLKRGPWGQSPRRGFWIKKRFFRRVHASLGGRMLFMASGAANLDPDLHRFFNLLGIKVFQGYGLTETSPLVSCNSDQGFKVGSVGRAIPGVEVRIEAPDPSGVGEIFVRGHNVMQGYFDDPEETRKAIDPHGWFKTGDLGYLDAEGFLFIVGRKREVIVTSNGKKVYPVELENHFGRMEGVKELCVFGLPQHSGGEITHLQIVPDRVGAAALGVQDPEARLRREVTRISATLPEYKRPLSLGFTDTPFPRTTTLKVKKYLVQQAYLKDLPGPVLHPEGARDPALKKVPGTWVVAGLRRIGKGQFPIRMDSLLALDLGMESLATLEFWHFLEKQGGRRFPEDQVLPLKSVGEVVGFLESQSGGTAVETSLAEAARGDWLQERDPEAEDLARRTLTSYPRLRPAALRALRSFFGWFSRLRIEGVENLPPTGPFILAPNHECHLDNLFVACGLPKILQQEMAVLGKKEHFERWITRGAAKLCHALPVDRAQVSSFPLKVCAEVLRRGGVLLIHPEGTRSPDGRLLPFKPGVAQLAISCACPILPVYIEGTHEFWPKGSLLPKRRSRITVRIGAPLQAPVRGKEVPSSDLQPALAWTRHLFQAVQALAVESKFLK